MNKLKLVLAYLIMGLMYATVAFVLGVFCYTAYVEGWIKVLTGITIAFLCIVLAILVVSWAEYTIRNNKKGR